VQFCLRFIVASLAAVVLPLATGCGRGGDGAAAGPAAIDGSEGGKGTSAADTAGSAPQQPRNDPFHPTVVIDTSLGSITVRLDKEKAPVTVDNFLYYVDSGYYDQTIFHQVIKDYPKVILGGAFTPDLTEKKARTPIYNEARIGLKNRRGTIAMARQPDAVHSATCYFFFNLTDNDVLDYKDDSAEGYGYCAFGQITQGLDVADRIASVPVHDTDRFERIPVEPVVIRSIRRAP
jgi:cyclophilin family peptidyl-prolyl cis-trans isomerase